jgi:hypothetical protein
MYLSSYSKEKKPYTIFLGHSWWPWRSSLTIGKCVLRTQDGWIKRPCSEAQAFICERDINRQSIPLTVRCGNIRPTTISSIKPIITTITKTTVPTTEHTTMSFIQPENISEENLFVQQQLSSTIYNKSQMTTNTIDPSMNNRFINE